MFNFIFDIGANIGEFLRKHADLNSNLRGVLIEANPSLINILNNRFKPPRFQVLNYLVDKDDDEFRDFYICTDHGLSTASIDWINKSRFANKCHWGNPIKIQTITINKLIKLFGVPDFIKIDVEGFEFDVLQGMSTYTGPISFEWAEEEYDKLNQSIIYLEKLGFNAFSYTNEDQYEYFPTIFSPWNSCPIHNDIDPTRKRKWGMIFAKRVV